MRSRVAHLGASRYIGTGAVRTSGVSTGGSRRNAARCAGPHPRGRGMVRVPSHLSCWPLVVERVLEATEKVLSSPAARSARERDQLDSRPPERWPRLDIRSQPQPHAVRISSRGRDRHRRRARAGSPPRRCSTTERVPDEQRPGSSWRTPSTRSSGLRRPEREHLVEAKHIRGGTHLSGRTAFASTRTRSFVPAEA